MHDSNALTAERDREHAFAVRSCAECGYDLQYARAGTAQHCPECGWSFDAEARQVHGSFSSSAVARLIPGALLISFVLSLCVGGWFIVIGVVLMLLIGMRWLIMRLRRRDAVMTITRTGVVIGGRRGRFELRERDDIEWWMTPPPQPERKDLRTANGERLRLYRLHVIPGRNRPSRMLAVIGGGGFAETEHVLTFRAPSSDVAALRSEIHQLLGRGPHGEYDKARPKPGNSS